MPLVTVEREPRNSTPVMTMKLKRASCDWQVPEHRPSACAPGGHSVRFLFRFTTEYNSAGRTDLEVCVPSPFIVFPQESNSE